MSGTIGRRGLLIGGGALAATPVIGRDHASAHGRGGRVRTGADVVAAKSWREFRGQRVGVITNPTGVLSDSLISIVDAMVAAGVTVGGVFGPDADVLYDEGPGDITIPADPHARLRGPIMIVWAWTPTPPLRVGLLFWRGSPNRGRSDPG